MLPENYDNIKKQLNANILKMSDKNEHELMLGKENTEKETIKLITKSNSFKKAIDEARDKLDLGEADDYPFEFDSSEEIVDTLVYVVAFYRGIAEPYLYKDSYNDEEKRAFEEKGEDYGVAFSQLGQDGVKKLEYEITEVINEVLKKSGMPETWFAYIGACLLGYNYFDFHIKVKSEHSKRLQVVNVERDFVDLRIWKGVKRSEYNDGWKALEDYLTHNVPLGLVRVEDEGTRFYNDKLNGKSTAELVDEYAVQHPCTGKDNAKRALLRNIGLRSKYKNIKK